MPLENFHALAFLVGHGNKTLKYSYLEAAEFYRNSVRVYITLNRQFPRHFQMTLIGFQMWRFF